MNKFKENLQIFKEYSQELYNTLTVEDDLYNTKIQKVEGQKNYIIETDKAKCFVHSIYSLENEMDIMFKNIDNKVECLIIFGLGSGYALDYVIKNFNFIKKIIIIESNLNLFREYLKHADIYGLVSKFKQISFIINKTQEQSAYTLGEILATDVLKGYSMVYNISYRTIYAGYYEYINKYLVERINHQTVNIITQENFKYVWPVNTIRNMKYNNELVDKLFGKFNNVPAILVSAGPSLNKNIHLLKEAKNRAIIVAVGSAIKILNNAGISPDFYFAVDGGKEEKKIFDNISTENTILIYGDKLYCEILPNYKGRKLKMILNLDFLGKYIYNKANISYVESNSGFSIANVALGVLNQFGCKKIIFMGQDLCYSDNKEYAEGSWKDEDLNFENNNFIKRKDINGKDVFTISSYLGMKKIFENHIKCNPNTMFINATQGGLGIEGTIIKNFKDVLMEDLSRDYDISETIDKLILTSNDEKNKEKISNSMRLMEAEIKELLFEIEKSIDNIQKKGSSSSFKVIEKEVNMINDKVELIQFYKDVVSTSLKFNFDSIDIKFNSNSNKDILLKNVLNKLIETREFLYLVEVLIKEYFDEKQLDIEF
ncbi:DUF115 domain-containing protein [Clostridium tagluense]|uniref:motility associated factor glycosyltransferase family protein n=1 Tax=Clostridium tagluense TaxID=360422 RepID=UPI001CF248D5|nr:6-hydroxymethylpterin diphosphokinase MptE-like protein [Clostridium tagluense]MCB2310033.1 DUF115 domain-containing protein [Clostridium tagluense]MCB2314437.1 DUF115 domain-containing protein [Clostridium tagluense]MCB2319283.1 DUF115 domain-containing protein [Clostridium tagluense]MCB2324627.1 DUF115 domain-containing protein [Clostridium tagluense]MCB2329478.1 DUF115 domain-containing protein [Clostridium tagluense]